MFTPFPIGALLGGDLNNSNGGCPSPVRKCSHACSDHVFKYLLTFCSLPVDKHSFWHLICIRVSVPNPFPFFSPSSFLLCTICDRALEGSGDATSNIHRHAWESLHLPWTCSVLYVAHCNVMAFLQSFGHQIRFCERKIFP